MRGVPLLWLFVIACGPGRTAPSVLAGAPGFREQFLDTSLGADWLAVTPSMAGAVVRVEHGELVLTLPTGNGDGAVSVKRMFDASRARGARMRLTVGVRTDAPAASIARATLTITRPGALPTYTDLRARRPSTRDPGRSCMPSSMSPRMPSPARSISC
jgi:hypothetical protein